jgi:hypothetical protein
VQRMTVDWPLGTARLLVRVLRGDDARNGTAGAGKADMPGLSCGSAAHTTVASDSARATAPHLTAARSPPRLISTPMDSGPPLPLSLESDLRWELRSSVHIVAARGHTCAEDCGCPLSCRRGAAVGRLPCRRRTSAAGRGRTDLGRAPCRASWRTRHPYSTEFPRRAQAVGTAAPRGNTRHLARPEHDVVRRAGQDRRGFS